MSRKNIIADENGQSLAEYAIILVLVAIVVIASIIMLGNNVIFGLWQTAQGLFN